MSVVRKKGRLVDIPVKRGTVVRLRENRSGNLTNQKAIVVGVAKASPYSRAYGRQVLVCTIYGKKSRDYYVSEKGAGDLYPVGAVKKIPKACRDAAIEYRKSYRR